MADSITPIKTLQLNDIVVDSFVPELIRKNGVCLALGLTFATYGSDAYEFDLLMLRRSGSGAAIFSEPLIYRDKNRLVMKDICRDIDRDLNGDLGSIYVQLHDRKTAAKAGASFWNLDPDSRSFNIAYQVTENTDSKDLTELIHDVLDTFADNYDVIMKQLVLPASM